MKSDVEMRDEILAEAVISGLSGAILCECGQSIEITRYANGKMADDATCGCGVKYRHFKSKGWVVGKRSLKAWKAREKQLLQQIHDLRQAQ